MAKSQTYRPAQKQFVYLIYNHVHYSFLDGDWRVRVDIKVQQFCPIVAVLLCLLT